MAKSSRKLFFQYNPNKTPLQNAMYRIKTAYIFAFISAGITSIFIILSMMGQDVVGGIDVYSIIDVVFILILAFIVMIAKSRVASIILFIYFLSSKVILFIENPAAGISSIFLTLIFMAAYGCGIVGTFSYYKIMKQKSNTQEFNTQEKIAP